MKMMSWNQPYLSKYLSKEELLIKTTQMGNDQGQ